MWLEFCVNISNHTPFECSDSNVVRNYTRELQISEFVKKFGKEENIRAFFNAYFAYLKTIPEISENILIDSTGLPNDIKMEYSAISNHNGAISRESRLIFVVERNTGFPVYFRYVAGNIVDVTILRTTLNQLKAQGVNVTHGIMDAGYCSEKNIKELFRQKIPFLIRLPGRSLSDNLIKEHGAGLFSTKYALRYGDRLIFMKRVSIELYDNNGFAYVAIDAARQKEEQSHYINKALDNPKMKEEISDEVLNSLGYFVLISSEELQTGEVLPLYYMRQTIEQTFDFAKNDVDLLPLRTHDEETFRGHLLLSFMATVVFITINRLLKKEKKLEHICAKMVFHSMRRVKCNVYERNIITTEANRIANLVLNELKMELPVTIDL
jgi:transposase